MPALILGPLLRHVGASEAMFWVETDAPCEVEVLGASEPTFSVCGHHYGVVCAGDLEPSTWHEYEVRLDGELVWPTLDEYPRSAFKTYPKERPVQMIFGSCRVAAPHTPPFSLRKDEDERGREIDALHTLAQRMRDEEREQWPDVLLLLGDQVYADEVSPETLAFIETRRDMDEDPGRRVLDFDEYTELYRESWSDPAIRWLLSTVASSMIFDDHDVHDDWNVSQKWLEEMRATDWWAEHCVGALMSYWVYQHLGNMTPELVREDPVLAELRKRPGDGESVLREFVDGGDRESSGSRWSYCRDIGDTRLIVIDARAGRVLEEGERDMVDEGEWDWIIEHTRGDFDHLLLATSLPYLLGPGMQYVEAWSEAVAGGAWGERMSGFGEWVRQEMDLEHWGAFQRSFHKMVELQRAVGAGEHGKAPASIVTLSGDVHHAYLFEVAYPKGSGVESAIWQAVCSPYRNPLDGKERNIIKLGMSRPFKRAWELLAKRAGVKDPGIRWRLSGGGPWFDNQVATLVIDGRRMDMHLDKAEPVDEESARLERVLDARLA